MAHLRELEIRCQVGSCTKAAKVELLNSRNASLGRYCNQCGKRALAEQKRQEGRI